MVSFLISTPQTGLDSIVATYGFFGWVFAIFPNSQDVHTIHHLGMWAIVVFIIVHMIRVYATASYKQRRCDGK